LNNALIITETKLILSKCFLFFSYRAGRGGRRLGTDRIVRTDRIVGTDRIDASGADGDGGAVGACGTDGAGGEDGLAILLRFEFCSFIKYKLVMCSLFCYLPF